MNKRYGRFGWSKGSLLNFSIGQGEILVTPIQVFNYTNLLATKGNANSPHLVSSIKKDRKYMLLNYKKRVNKNDLIDFKKLIERRKKGEPVAYLTNYKEFWKYRYFVNKRLTLNRVTIDSECNLEVYGLITAVDKDHRSFNSSFSRWRLFI